MNNFIKTLIEDDQNTMALYTIDRLIAAMDQEERKELLFEILSNKKNVKENTTDKSGDSLVRAPMETNDTPLTSQDHLFSRIVKGDLVHANMPLTDDELQKIDPNHRHRPYLVIAKKEDSLICFACSSKERIGAPRFPISTMRFDVWKNGYVYFDKVVEVPKENVIEILDSPSEAELIDIERTIRITNNTGYQLPTLGIDVLPKEGDIVKFDLEKFLIYAKSNKEYYAYPVKYSKQDYRWIEIKDKGKTYFVNPTQEKLGNITDFPVIDSVSVSCLDLISRKRREKINATAPKKVQMMEGAPQESDYFFKYPSGTKFKFKDTTEETIYICTNKDRDYGFYSEDLYKTNIQLRQLDMDTCKEEKGKMEWNSFQDVIKRIIRTNPGYWSNLEAPSIKSWKDHQN